MGVRILFVLFARVAVALSLTLGFGCSPETHELLSLSDVNPKGVQLGTSLTISGLNLPTGPGVQGATIQFRGDVLRPGEPTKHNVLIEARSSSLDADGIQVVVDEALRAAFCGHGDSARHAIFRGSARVEVPVSQGSVVLAGTLKDFELEFASPPVRGSVRAALQAEAQRSLEFMGITPGSSEADARVVASVRTGGPADRGGVQVGDALLTLNGVPLASREDYALAESQGEATLVVDRAGSVRELNLPVEGYRKSLPESLLGGGVVLVFAIMMLLLWRLPFRDWLVWLSAHSATQPKRRARRAGIVGALPLTGLFVSLPLVCALLERDVDLVFVTFAATMVALLGAGWGLWASPPATPAMMGWKDRLGRMSVAVLREVVFAVVALAVAIRAGSVRVDAILVQQSGEHRSGWMHGGSPLQWLGLESPWMLVAAAVGLVILALWVPRNLGALAVGTWASAARFLLGATVYTTLFCGGWTLPGVVGTPATWGAQLLGAALFALKTWMVIGVARWARSRLLTTQALELRSLGFVLLPAGLLSCAATWAQTRWVVPAPIPDILAIATAAGTLLVVAMVVLATRARAERQHLNPFL